MRKCSILLCLLVAFAILLSACGAKEAYYQTNTEVYYPDSSAVMTYEDNLENAELLSTAESVAAKAKDGTAGVGENEVNTRKIVHTADVMLESLDFEKAVTSVKELVSQMGGYIESSSYHGNAIKGSRNSRYFSLVARVPDGDYSEFVAKLGEHGNVSSCNEYSKDITTQYYDTDSRITALETEQERLLAMLEKADSVETMLLIEEQLSDVNYRLDYFKTTLRGFDQQTSFATVNIEIEEVIEYTEQQAANPSLGERIAVTFKNSIKAVKSFLEGTVVVLTAILPFALVFGVLAFIVIFIIVRIRKKHPKTAEKRAGKKDKKKKETKEFKPDDYSAGNQ